MKKVVCIILLFILVCLPLTVKATNQVPEETNGTANITFSQESTANTVTIKINAGEFVNGESNSVMNAEMSLNYDETHVERIEGQSFNNWDITIIEETKRVILEYDAANPNTEIAEITFYLRQDSTETLSGTVSISDFTIADGNAIDETYPEYSANYTIEPTGENPGGDNTNEITPDQNIVIDTDPEEETNGITITNPDNTMSPDEKLPQTGMNIAIMVAIITILVLAVVGLIKYKQIEVK